MPRITDRKEHGFIPIPKDMQKASWKVVITDTAGTTYDVSNYVLTGLNITRIATLGISNFNFNIDNSQGTFTGKFDAGDSVDFYYDYLPFASLTTVRMRGYIDGVYDNFDGDAGWTLSIEGRDAPKGHENQHFVDSHITLQFSNRNNLECWSGTTGDVDAEGNYADGILYNSGTIMKVYDTSSSSWKVWKDLTAGEKTTLMALTGYTQRHTNTYVEKSRLSISSEVAEEGDFDFRIWYDSSSGNTYFMIHPEEAIKNNTEHVSMGQNLIALSRYGQDYTEMFNRVKEKGMKDGNLILMRTAEDSDSQTTIWIKDKEETTSALELDDDLIAKAAARLATLKTPPKKGGISCCALPSLQPAERIPVNVPYIINDYIKIKSFTVNINPDIEFNLDIQDRETRFEKIFKERIDDTVNVSPTDNPKGLENAVIFDFSDAGDYTLDNCQIVSGVLTLSAGFSSGTCTTTAINSETNITLVEIRVKASQMWTCTYEVSNDGGTTWEDYELGTLHEFSSTGSSLKSRVTLNESTANVNPQFDKINLIWT